MGRVPSRLYIYPQTLVLGCKWGRFALNRRRALLSVINTEVVGFEKIKNTYELCPDFENIFTVLRDGLTHKVDDFLL